MDFTGQIAVVTGAASGIGRAIALALAGNAAGWDEPGPFMATGE